MHFEFCNEYVQFKTQNRRKNIMLLSDLNDEIAVNLSSHWFWAYNKLEYFLPSRFISFRISLCPNNFLPHRTIVRIVYATRSRTMLVVWYTNVMFAGMLALISLQSENIRGAKQWAWGDLLIGLLIRTRKSN